ncbi:hypothetical protein LCGC14_1300300 [marine sediment metagenome]|uniref:Gingipain domain-containing protein n=1 Tax=marine sediment metagenome TaxID=412755 RepID=A0A0F9KR91_9ZZZZ|nr:hypothetical protein [bacterium]
MTGTVLAIDSNYDQLTNIAWDYRKNIIYPYMNSKGFSFICATGILARRWFVRINAVNRDVVYITGVGHGSPHVYTGHNGMPIFKKGRYSREEVQNKVVHFLSCYTAQLLGPNFVKHGCKAYFGYSQAFTVSDLNYKDIFFRCDGEIDIAFADGNQASLVHQRTVNLFTYAIQTLINSRKFYTAAALQHNLDCLRSPSNSNIWGNRSATI